MTKVIIKKNAGCFELPRAIVNELWEHNPEVFGEPLDDFIDIVAGNRTFEEQYNWAVERNGLAYFLELHSRELRTLPWLVEKVLSGEMEGRRANQLVVVELPEDVVDWYIFVREDGSEVIHEAHRTFEPEA
jgi:hypothetical protein